MSSSKPKGLGRGLSALMADVEIDREGQNISMKPESISELQVPIEKIHPNPEQPRRSFKSGDLDDLANSIRSKGVIQPLIVRRHPKKEEEYEIVAGERRWRRQARTRCGSEPAAPARPACAKTRPPARR